MRLRNVPAVKSCTLGDIVPPGLCTRHVASSVFYHCLGMCAHESLILVLERSQPVVPMFPTVLATKDLIHVEQAGSTGAIQITKKTDTGLDI
jgi:hypothetical protein